MSYRIIDIVYPASRQDQITKELDKLETANWTKTECIDGRLQIRVLTSTANSQLVIDKLQTLLGLEPDWRLVVLPVEAALFPGQKEQQEDKARAKQQKTIALREEIYQDVEAGAKLTTDFVALTILSSIVAAIGINANNVAVVIGAMVIAPLLGPLLAFSFASALGDLKLMVSSARTAGVGLAAGFATAFILAGIIDVNLNSTELTSRTVIGLDMVVLALASGAAAALSIVTGLSSALVGVMVAVALLPPSVAIALFLGAGEAAMAGRAALLLVTNVVSVNIASQIVFALKGIRPRTWLERRSAKRSKQINLVVWGILLAALVVLIATRII